MNLIERIETLCERANGQRALEEDSAESRRLQPLLDEARKFSQNLAQEVEQLRLLQDQCISISAPESATSARNTLGGLRKRFSKKPRAEQLTHRKDWNRLKDQVLLTCRSLSSALDAAWRQFVGTAFSGGDPNSLRSTLPSTPDNLRSFEHYRLRYAELSGFARSRPTGRADFERVRDLARLLTEIHGSFDFHVPEDVKRFLRAVAEDGADIGLLTAGVRNWLEAQGTSAHYRIVARTDS